MIENLFIFLFLISLVCLIIGLIKSSIFNRIFRREVNRKSTSLIFGLAFVIFFILVGITTPVHPSNEVKTSEMIKAEKEVQAKVDANQVKAEAEWRASKAGQICQNHPNWGKDDCNMLAANKIWIGMSLDMLIYKRGKPDHTNVSNYGSGNQYQYCWDDYTPSCFYDNNADGILDSYN